METIFDLQLSCVGFFIYGVGSLAMVKQFSTLDEVIKDVFFLFFFSSEMGHQRCLGSTLYNVKFHKFLFAQVHSL